MGIDNIEEKIKNLEDWNSERSRVKPFIDEAVDYHNKARNASRRRDYKTSSELYKSAIEKYKEAMTQNPKYYLKDLVERIDNVIVEYINNDFNLKTSGDNLKNKEAICEFINFIDNLKEEERKCIDTYNIAWAYLQIVDFYYTNKDYENALELCKKVVDIRCDRPFVNRDSYFKMGKVFLEQDRFKEGVVSFVSALSFDRDSKEIIGCLEKCLDKLGILEHKSKFLTITPNEAKKLIMEVM